MVTSSPTRMPPVSSAAFQVKPKSLRLIFVTAEIATRILPCRAGNVSLGGHFDESDSGQVGDEFCHAHSAYLRRRCQRQERQRDATHRLTEFVEFLRREDAGVLPVMGAIAATTTPAAATELLGATKADFCRARSQLRRLGSCFLGNEPVPRKRRPYRRRVRSPHR
jgi:hypothetical protein